MYNSLHYTYYLYIVMYYRNNLVSLGEEYDKSGKLHSFLIQRNECTLEDYLYGCRDAQ